MNTGSIAIIIVNWNTGKLLGKCLQALEALPEKHLIEKVYVIDNASKDNSLELAKGVPVTFPLDIEESTVNLGFAKANNRAFKKLRDAGSSAHILLLNPDTEMRPGSLQAMNDALVRNPKAGVVGLKLLNTDGSIQESVRAFPTFPVFLTFFLKIKNWVQEKPFWKTYMQTGFNYGQEQVVDQVMGAAFCIRNETWIPVGDLDERYWIWFEEVDYCQRVKKTNWDILYTPTGEVTHHGSVSFYQRVGLQRTWPFLQSCLVYTGIYEQPWQFMILWLLTPVALALSIPASFSHLRQRQSTKGILYE